MRGSPERERFVDRLVEEGRILATERAMVIAMLNYLDLYRDRELIIGDGRRMSPLAICEELLRTKPPASAEERLSALADEKARKDGVSYAEAFRLVQFEYPALARAYFPVYRTYSEEDPTERLNAIAEKIYGRGEVSFAEAYRQAQIDNPALARECVAFLVS
ncbi:MAG: hypothetical protein ABSG35_14375 [Syntrophobacteraceae bacterium]|jgi:hypothetical protein